MLGKSPGKPGPALSSGRRAFPGTDATHDVINASEQRAGLILRAVSNFILYEQKLFSFNLQMRLMKYYLPYISKGYFK